MRTFLVADQKDDIFGLRISKEEVANEGSEPTQSGPQTPNPKIFINDLDSTLTSSILKFADDTKLFGRVNADMDRKVLPRDICTDSLNGLKSGKCRLTRGNVLSFTLVTAISNLTTTWTIKSLM